MNLPEKPIEKVEIFFAGDPSVGIRSSSFTMELFLDLNCFAEPENVLKETRNKIQELYSEIMDEKCGVMFDFEIENENKNIDKIMNELETGDEL